MKNIGFICILLFGLAACQKQDGFVVKGKFSGAPEGTVVYLGDDSTQIVNGEFVFKGKVAAPQLMALQAEGVNEYGYPDYNGALLWINNEDLHVECPWDQLKRVYVYTEGMKVSGSELNSLYRDYQRQAAAISAPRDSLWKIYQEVYLTPSFEGGHVDSEAGMKVMRKINGIAARKRKLARDFVAANPSSPAAVDVLTGQLTGQNYTVEEARQMINSLDTTLKTIPAYPALMEAFENFCPTAKGEKYIDVTLTDKTGKQVKLSDYILPGKYNMIEVWASWCSPCRGEIPHLRHVNEACGEDFNMISISIDDKDADWQKAMKEERMVWTQLNVPGGFRGEICKKYGIQGVPYSLILDGDGRIIAGEVRGAELDVLLVDLLGEKANGL